MVTRWIAHLDMDAFYASVELLRYPELRGQAVVVGGGSRHQPVIHSDGSRSFSRLREYAGRGVVTTATYAARDLGVHSGLGLMKAAALAPDAVLLPTDFDEYRSFSRRFKAAVAEVAPIIEDRGIDEIYIDLTDVAGISDAISDDTYAGVRLIARKIKDRVNDTTGLTCSIGITPNKLLAKLCSDLDKPDGLTIITAADIPKQLWTLPVGRINGVGPKANARLEALGIQSIGDLAAADTATLVQEFGDHYGAWLHEVAHGRDDRPVITHSEPKSISRETTFERDLHPKGDRDALGRIFTQLCERLAGDLMSKHYSAQTIGIKLRYHDFKIVTREMTLPVHTDDAQVIRQAAGHCLKRVPLDRRLRLLGVRAGGLRSATGEPVDTNNPRGMKETKTQALPLFPHLN